MNDILAVKRDGTTTGDGFSYDLTQQITAFKREGTNLNLTTGTMTGGTNNAMEFDGCGNRTKLNSANQTFNTMNQPDNIPHDSSGNLQSYNGWLYTYDAQNRLRIANNPTTNIAEYFFYDGLNRQVARGTTIEVDITFRAFIKQQAIAGYHGDHRGFSASPSASSRVSVSVRVETDPSKNGGKIMVGTPTVTVSPTRPVGAGAKERTSTGPLMPQVGTARDKNGNTSSKYDDGYAKSVHSGNRVGDWLRRRDRAVRWE